MNTIFPTRALARTIPLAQQKAVVDFRRHASAPCPSALGDGRSRLRAKWAIDPASGRLACRWALEDEVTDSRRLLYDTNLPEGGLTDSREALAA